MEVDQVWRFTDGVGEHCLRYCTGDTPNHVREVSTNAKSFRVLIANKSGTGKFGNSALVETIDGATMCRGWLDLSTPVMLER